jgi:zinc protease
MNISDRNRPDILPVKNIILPEIESFRLKNGVQVFLIESGSEEIMRLEFIFSAGQIKENMPLLASTTNMMLTEGSVKYKSEELNSLLDYYGTFLNLSAEKDYAGLSLLVLNKHFEKILGIILEIIFNPVFPEPEFTALMNKRLQWYLLSREKVQSIATDLFFESVFGKHHPYGRKVNKADFSSLNTFLLKDFHSEYYTAGNLTIIIAGRIHSRTCGLLESYFGDIPVQQKGDESKPEIPEPESIKKIHSDKKGSVQTAIRIGSKTINKRHPDYPGLKVLNSLLGGFFGSRLMKKIREEKGYTYGISSNITSCDLTGYKVISTDVSHRNVTDTIRDIYREIEHLQNIPVGSEELTVLKNYMSGELVRMFDGPFAVAESFKSVWEFGMDFSYFLRFSEKIKTITPDEIIELARTYYVQDELHEITVGGE